jgi:hypothetical protein
MPLLGQTSEARTILSRRKRKETLPLLPPPKQRATLRGELQKTKRRFVGNVSWECIFTAGNFKKVLRATPQSRVSEKQDFPSKTGLKAGFKKVLRASVSLSSHRSSFFRLFFRSRFLDS